MNTDIRVSISFKNHRKRKKLKLFLGAGATDFLIDLWLTAAIDRPDGVLSGLDDVDLALMAGWDGEPAQFIDGLVRAGFLERDETAGCYILHDWQEHNGYAASAEDRSARGRFNSFKRWNPEKAAELESMGISGLSAEEHRELKSHPKREPIGVLMGTHREPIEEPNAPIPAPAPTPIPKPNKKTKGTDAGAGSGFVLPDWVPLVEWNGFVEMRKKSRKPLTDYAKTLVLAALEKLVSDGEDAAAVLNQSTAKNWLGVFPVKGDENGRATAGNGATRGKTEDARARVGLNPTIGGKGDFVHDFPDRTAEW
jgi:hypothetical protein